jgi:hypothetical protein
MGLGWVNCTLFREVVNEGSDGKIDRGLQTARRAGFPAYQTMDGRGRSVQDGLLRLSGVRTVNE